MANENVTSGESPRAPDLFELSTQLEEATSLLRTYCDVMADANCYRFTDAEQSGEAQNRIYAMLAAIRPQIDRLKGLPEQLAAIQRSLAQEESV